MKVNSITTNIGYLKGRTSERSTGKERECVQNNLKQLNNDQINTTIKKNSDGRVSFKGGTPLLHKVANYTTDNPLVAEALFAILITCALRPLTIMATAKTEEDKEKCAYQAAKSVSTGLVGLGMSAIVGNSISAAAKLASKKGAFGMPGEMEKASSKLVESGVKDLRKVAKRLAEKGKDLEFVDQINGLINGKKLNLSKLKDMGKGAEKIFKGKISELAPEMKDVTPDLVKNVTTAINEQKTIDAFARTSKNIIDKMFQPVFMPLRATITVALVPVILKALGLKKTSSKPKTPEQSVKVDNVAKNEPKETKQKNANFGTNDFNIFHVNDEKDIFKSFLGMVTNENK